MFIVLTFVYCIRIIVLFIREGLSDILLSDIRRLIESCLSACCDAIGPRKELTSEIVSREFEKIRVEPRDREVDRADFNDVSRSDCSQNKLEIII